MELFVSTSNKHKLQEISRILKGFKVKGVSLNIKENGNTFEKNAVKKAKALWQKTKKLSIADDSGLMVNALKGKPGIKSARFATPPTPQNLCKKLLRLMKDKKNRKAKFVCSIAIVTPKGKTKKVKGIVNGTIGFKMEGEKGFGYDPVFIPEGNKKTFAQMPASQKNKLSHRYKALIKAKKILRSEL